MPGYDTIAKARKARISPKKQNANDALFYVAQNKYTQFENYYSTLIKGPREKARKYRTYELVLACFTLDPVQFSLSRRELDFRMQKLGLKTEEIPPAASLNSTLGALKSFQEKRELELIEWVPKEDKLYIVEPSFLFYVRWRRRKEASPQQLDLFEELLERLTARKISVWNAAE